MATDKILFLIAGIAGLLIIYLSINMFFPDLLPLIK